MSKLVKRIIDIASFYNVNFFEVCSDIRDAKRGNTFSLRKYGVLLNDVADIDLEIMRQTEDADGAAKRSGSFEWFERMMCHYRN